MLSREQELAQRRSNHSEDELHAIAAPLEQQSGHTHLVPGFDLLGQPVSALLEALEVALVLGQQRARVVV